MADLDLRVDYKDDILDSSVNTKRKYNIIENEDGTKSLEDVSVYTQNGDSFGAADINKTNQAVLDLNSSLEWVKIYNRPDGVNSITTLQHEKLKTAKEISILFDYGSEIKTVPSEALKRGISVHVSLYSNNTWYTNSSNILLDAESGTLTSIFAFGEIYTGANGFVEVYCK